MKRTLGDILDDGVFVGFGIGVVDAVVVNWFVGGGKGGTLGSSYRGDFQSSSLP